MAKSIKKKEKVKDIEVEAHEVKVDVVDVDISETEIPITKPKVELKEHTLKRKIKVSGKWKQPGETIKLTKEAFEDFRIKKII
jgi:hypothetical protein